MSPQRGDSAEKAVLTKFEEFCVIARSEATWQSPVTYYAAQPVEEIPTGLRPSE